MLPSDRSESGVPGVAAAGKTEDLAGAVPSTRLTADELLKQLIQHMCNEPDAVSVDFHASKNAVYFDVTVADGDVGTVLGVGGSHVYALRALFEPIYGKSGKVFHLMVVNPRRLRR